jgi:cytochrome c556
MKPKSYAAAIALVTATAIAAFAHGGATGIVKERMDAMDEMGKATESLTKIMRGQERYDAAAVAGHAATIKSHAGDALTALFPEGSDTSPSEARPEIWSEWDRFVGLAQRLDTLAGGLEAAAANGLAANGSTANSMGMMMGTSDAGMSMMGGGAMMGGGMDRNMPDPEMLAQMPADAVFAMMAQTCSACHTDFRLESR